MGKEGQIIREEGIIEEALPNLLFKVKLDNGNRVLAHPSGKMKLYRIRVIPGDRVILEMTPYDEKRGRITKRL